MSMTIATLYTSLPSTLHSSQSAIPLTSNSLPPIVGAKFVDRKDEGQPSVPGYTTTKRVGAMGSGMCSNSSSLEEAGMMLTDSVNIDVLMKGSTYSSDELSFTFASSRPSLATLMLSKVSQNAILPHGVIHVCTPYLLKTPVIEYRRKASTV